MSYPLRSLGVSFKESCFDAKLFFLSSNFSGRGFFRRLGIRAVCPVTGWSCTFARDFCIEESMSMGGSGRAVMGVRKRRDETGSS